MKLRSRSCAALAFASTCAFSPAAYSVPLTTLQFNGTVFGNPALLNNSPNVLNLSQNSLVSGTITFDTDTVPFNPGDPKSTMYTNTVSRFTFMNEAASASSIDYTYVNIAPAYGYVQFYANVLHDGFSDVFTSNFYTAPNAFQLSSFDFLDLGNSISAYGEWMYQRYDFSTRQVAHYSGPITSFVFDRVDHAVPEPAGYNLLLIGICILALLRSRGRSM